MKSTNYSIMDDWWFIYLVSSTICLICNEIGWSFGMRPLKPRSHIKASVARCRSLPAQRPSKYKACSEILQTYTGNGDVGLSGTSNNTKQNQSSMTIHSYLNDSMALLSIYIYLSCLKPQQIDLYLYDIGIICIDVFMRRMKMKNVNKVQ